MTAFRIVSFVLLAGLLSGCALLDGPVGPFPGGALRDGELVDDENVDWEAATAELSPLFIELQLVEPPRSRTTGAFVLDGDLYIPCDLGFIWQRIPAPTRWVLATIYRVKDWHEDALADGRVVLRIGDRRYERQATRITDPVLLSRLRARIEDDAQNMLDEPLLEMPEEGPREIWFFRIDPRAPTRQTTAG